MSNFLNRWTDEDEKIVMDCIKKNPENLTYAFKQAVKISGRTFRAISARYYNTIRLKQSLFLLKGDESVINTKNVIKKESEGFSIVSFETLEQTFKNVVIQVGNKKIIAKEATIVQNI